VGGGSGISSTVFANPSLADKRKANISPSPNKTVAENNKYFFMMAFLSLVIIERVVLLTPYFNVKWMELKN